MGKMDTFGGGTNLTLDKLWSDRRKQFRNKLGDKDKPILNMLVFSLAEVLCGISPDDLDSTYVETKISKKLQKHLYSFMYQHGKQETKQVGITQEEFESAPVSKATKGMPSKARMEIYGFYCNSEQFIENKLQLKSFLYRTANSFTLSDTEYIDTLELKSFFVMKQSFHEEIEDEGELNYEHTRIYSALLLFMTCIKLIQIGKIPLYRTEDIVQYLTFSKSYDRNVETYINLVDYKTYGNELSSLSNRIKGADLTFFDNIFMLAKFGHDCLQGSYAQLAKFNNVYIPLVEPNCSDAFDEAFHLTSYELKQRPALLPSSGMVFTDDELRSAMESQVEGSLEAMPVYGFTYYLNEVITPDENLYLFARLVDNKGTQQFFVYNPVDVGLLYSNCYIDEDCTLSFNMHYLQRVLAGYMTFVELLGTPQVGVESGSIKRLRDRISDSAYTAVKFITGYTRKVPAGQTPSAEARQSAKNLGLVLADNETYVRPFDRIQHYGSFGGTSGRGPLKLSDCYSKLK